MGDVRFDMSLERVETARRQGTLGQVSPETGVQALGALAAEADPVLANVLATRLLNQFRRSATLLRFAAEGVVALDADGRILYANPAAGRMLGWEEGALLGRDFHDTVHHRRRGVGDVPRQECDLLRALHSDDEDATPVDDHDVFERQDGSAFTAGFVAAPIIQQREATGLAVVFRDITAQKDHEATLALHRAALDAVPMPVFWLARDGRILYTNVAASDHLGYTRDELTRMRVFDVDPDVDPERWDAHWQRVKGGEVARIDSRHRTRDGDLLPVRVDLRHVEHEGREFHVAVVRRRQGA